MTPSATVENYLKALHDAAHGLAADDLVPVGLRPPGSAWRPVAAAR